MLVVLEQRIVQAHRVKQSASGSGSQVLRNPWDPLLKGHHLHPCCGPCCSLPEIDTDLARLLLHRIVRSSVSSKMSATGCWPSPGFWAALHATAALLITACSSHRVALTCYLCCTGCTGRRRACPGGDPAEGARLPVGHSLQPPPSPQPEPPVTLINWLPRAA